MHTKELKTAIHAALKAGEIIIEGCTTNTGISKDSSLAARSEIESALTIFDIPLSSADGTDTKKWWDISALTPSDVNNGENQMIIQIALLEDNAPVLGVKYLPLEKTLFFHNITGAYIVEQVTAGNSYEVDLSARKLNTINF